MSEPTYRVDLSHNPEKQPFPWFASIVRLSDDAELALRVGETREDAFARAQGYIVAMKEQQTPSSVLLSEDGDILDPHEVQR